MMSSTSEERRLWIALSDIFVDNETDYEYIARVAKLYPFEQVRFAFYRRVAPVCIYNAFGPAPAVWTGFDEKELCADIEKYIEEESRRLIVGDIVSFLGRVFVWTFFREALVKVKEEIDKAVTTGGDE